MLLHLLTHGINELLLTDSKMIPTLFTIYIADSTHTGTIELFLKWDSKNTAQYVTGEFINILLTYVILWKYDVRLFLSHVNILVMFQSTSLCLNVAMSWLVLSLTTDKSNRIYEVPTNFTFQICM
jgi:hypothetical protein